MRLNRCSKFFISIFLSVLIFYSLFSILYSTKALAQLNPQQRNMSVSAVVPPGVSDFQFDFQYLGNALVNQNEIITYEITYGVDTSAGINEPHTITVHYSDDKTSDNVTIADYVFGSATDGYGGTQPVIDTQNRTITWHIASLPAGTVNQKVQFKLRTTNYTADEDQLTFRSMASMRNDYVTIPDYGVEQDFIFDPTLVTPTPTPTQIPQAPLTIQPTSNSNQQTPTKPLTQTAGEPTITNAELLFSDISLRLVSESLAKISVTTNQPTTKVILYGRTPQALSQRTSSTDQSLTQVLDLPNLSPATQYYYQVIATDSSGVRTASDILTFLTAQPFSKVQVGRDAFTITSRNIVLLSNILPENISTTEFVMIPEQTSYKLTYTFATPPTNTLHEIIVSNDQGILQRVQMTEIDPRTYIAQLRTITQGTYNIDMIQTDDKGNLIGRKISTLVVSPKFKVLESKSSRPLPDARVTLYKYNVATKQFELLDDSLFENPSFTNLQGEIEMILNSGRYRVIVNALGYKEAQAEFTIDPKSESGYPILYLEQNLNDLPSWGNSLVITLNDTFKDISEALKSVSGSIRAFTAVAAVSISSMVFVGFTLFTFRTDIRWKDILPFFIFRLAFVRGKHTEKYLFGVVKDKSGKLLGGVRLEFVHLKTGVILAHTVTNQSGGFRVANTFDVPYVQLIASKDGMPPLALIVATDTKNVIPIKMNEHKPYQKNSFVAGIKHVAGGFFEITLILSLILELLFIEAFGVAKTFPFIALTFFNLALWIFYEKERNRHQT